MAEAIYQAIGAAFDWLTEHFAKKD